MNTKSVFKWFFLVLILVVPCIFIGVASVSSKMPEPPPEGFKLTGPAAVGKLTLYPDGTANFVGTCKGDTITVDVAHLYTTVGYMSKEELDGMYFGSESWPTEVAACYSQLDFPPPLLIIQAAPSVTNNPPDNTVADVVILGLVIK